MARTKPRRSNAKRTTAPAASASRPARRRAVAPARAERRPRPLTQRRAPERAEATLHRDPLRVLERQPWNTLRPLLAGSDAEREGTLARLRAFALELLRWNRGVSNLISHDDEARLVERHIAESLAGAQAIKSLGCKQLVDFGSGGGFPALPLAIAGAGEHWTLVESRRNKTLFLRRAIEELDLRRIDVVTGRLEVLVAEDAAALRCDGFTSRATMKAGPTLALAAHVVQPGGHAILWKGSGLEAELVASRPDWEVDWSGPDTRMIGDGPNSISVFTRSA